MAHTEVSLLKLTKEELVRITLDLQKKQDLLLNKINNDLADLRKNYSALESELSVSRTVTTNQKKQIVELERNCWSNEQYSRRECLEVTGIPGDTHNDKLEETVLNVFKKIDVNVQAENIEACHWLKSKNSAKKVIVKFSRRKDADNVRKSKKKLKNANLSTLGINNPVFVNDSLCKQYKSLWSKCKKLFINKFLHGFWVTNGTIRIKVEESSTPTSVTHLSDLEDIFPGNPLLAEQNEG